METGKAKQKLKWSAICREGWRAVVFLVIRWYWIYSDAALMSLDFVIIFNINSAKRKEIDELYYKEYNFFFSRDHYLMGRSLDDFFCKKGLICKTKDFFERKTLNTP